MKFSRVIFSLALIFAFGGLMLAQDTKPSSDLKQKIKTFKNNRRFSVRYDKFKNSTHVSVGPFNIGGDKAYIFSGAMLGMGADFFFQGQTLKEGVEEIYLVFDSRSKDWRFLDGRDLYAIVDGERMELGKGERSSDVRRGSVSELIIYKLPIDTFSKIANAKAVELKVGSIELKLKDEHLIAFKDLLSLTKVE
jgi:hypothetical protein